MENKTKKKIKTIIIIILLIILLIGICFAGEVLHILFNGRNNLRFGKYKSDKFKTVEAVEKDMQRFYDVTLPKYKPDEYDRFSIYYKTKKYFKWYETIFRPKFLRKKCVLSFHYYNINGFSCNLSYTCEANVYEKFYDKPEIVSPLEIKKIDYNFEKYGNDKYEAICIIAFENTQYTIRFSSEEEFEQAFLDETIQKIMESIK